MRGRVFLLGAALSGCGVLSGLDDLTIEGDASVLDASDADAPSIDAAVVTTDASDAAPMIDAGTPGSVKCGTSVCTGVPCCVTQLGQTCAKDCNGTTTMRLDCDDKGDCTSDQTCCLSNNTAHCQSNAIACANPLCANDQQCASTLAKCKPFDAGYAISLSRCQ